MEKLVRLFSVAILQLLLLGATGQEIPELPDYFSGYVESHTMLLESGTLISNLSKEYFDGTVQLTRNDLAADTLFPGATGMLSIITDPTHKVQYFIHRETRNCTVETLTTMSFGGGDLIVDPDGTYRFGRLEDVFYMVNASDYTYVGNSSAHGVILDDWTYTGDIERSNIMFQNVTVVYSTARNGAPSTYSRNMGPVPWRFSVEGRISVNDGAFDATISLVTRLFDLSFEEPDYDVFDVSICADPMDYLVLTMAVPKDSNEVDYSSYRKNVRHAVVGYTKVLPIQVGGIEIVKDNGTALFTTAQISNLTAKANISDAVTVVTALAAVSKIYKNTVGGALPFQIEITSGVMVTPQQVEVMVVEPSSPVQSLSVMPTPTSTVAVTVTPSNCPTVPVSSVYVCPTSMPAPIGKAYSQSYVVGLAFGMIILGAAVATLSLCLGMYVCTRFKKMSFRTGYERQVNPSY